MVLVWCWQHWFSVRIKSYHFKIRGKFYFLENLQFITKFRRQNRLNYSENGGLFFMERICKWPLSVFVGSYSLLHVKENKSLCLFLDTKMQWLFLMCMWVWVYISLHTYTYMLYIHLYTIVCVYMCAYLHKLYFS